MPQVSSAYATKQRAQRLARIGIIAALYAALTLAALLFLGGLAWGPVQFRISEAVVVIALFTADAIPGLTLGCVIANLANMVISGTGALGLLDVVFGSLATALGAWFTWKNRKNVPLALLGPVLANAAQPPHDNSLPSGLRNKHDSDDLAQTLGAQQLAPTALADLLPQLPQHELLLEPT